MEISSTPRCEMNDHQQSQFHNPSPHSVSASTIIMAPFFAKKLKSCQAWQSVSGDHIYLSCLRNIFWWSISSLTPACPTQTSLSWLGSRSAEGSDLLHPIILKTRVQHFILLLDKVHTQVECLRQAPAPTGAAENSQGVVSLPRYPAVLRSPWQSWKVCFFVRKIKVFSDYWLSSVHLKWWFQ